MGGCSANEECLAESETEKEYVESVATEGNKSTVSATEESSEVMGEAVTWEGTGEERVENYEIFKEWVDSIITEGVVYYEVKRK
uniref:hypothetical protein n=1 Tax=Acetatifactor sp. TaxID=1872090 RepID=UPI0040576945